MVDAEPPAVLVEPVLEPAVEPVPAEEPALEGLDPVVLEPEGVLLVEPPYVGLAVDPLP